MSASNTLNAEMPSSRFDLNRALIIVAVIAVLPIALEYAIRMWGEGHYQFFPLFIGVVGYLFAGRFEEIAADTRPGDRLTTIVWMLLAIVLIFSSAFVSSSFLGAVAMYTLFTGVLYWLMSTRGLINALPFLLLLLLAIPFPANIDNLIIVKLQFLASNFASWILDLFGLIHFREGVVLVTAEQQFFTEEACSGIRSLYSSMAAIGIYCVLCRYGWIRSAFNLAQTFFWVIFGNALRVATVVWVSDNWTTSIAEGLPHDLLGIGVFVLIILLAISTDRLISSMFPYIESESELDESVIEVRPVMQSRQIFGRLNSGWFVKALIPLFLIAFLIGCRMNYVHFTQDRSLTFLLDDRLPMMTEEDMPAVLNGWKRGNYERIRRGHSKIFAEDSFTWEYELKDDRPGVLPLSCLVSVDCPWHEFHDLVVCYESKGWRSVNVEIVGADGGQAYKEVGMERYSGAKSLVLYSGLDRTGNVVPPPRPQDTFDIQKRWLAGLRLLLGMEFSAQLEAADIQLPITMVQIYVEPDRELDEVQRGQIREMFQSVRQRLIESPRFKPTAETNP